MIVPFPPGRGRHPGAAVAEAMGRAQEPIVVENKAGAGGGVGMQYVAHAKPDGYTVLMALSSISIIPEADKVLGRRRCSARPARADRALHRRSDGPRGARRQPVEERRTWSRRAEGARGDPLRLLGQLRNHARADGNVRGARACRCCTCPSPAPVPRSWLARRPGGRAFAGSLDVMGHIKGGKVRVLALGERGTRDARRADAEGVGFERSSRNGPASSCRPGRPSR